MRRLVVPARARDVAPRRPAGFQAFPPPTDATSIPQRFFEMARRHPKQAAIDTRLMTTVASPLISYADLAAAVTTLAGRVHRALEGASPDSMVGLLCDHTAAWPLSMLATLHANRAYVPLDPTHPPARLQTLVHAGQVALLLHDTPNADLAARITADANSPIPCCNLDDQPLAPSPAESPSQPATPDALAYLLYTSGSTGGPKGVLQRQRHVWHFIGAYTDNLYIAPRDRLLWLAPAASDAAVMDIYGALLNGATLIPWSLKTQGLAGVGRVLREHAITLYHSTPTIWRHVCDTLNTPEALPELRAVVLGGEPVHLSDVDRFRRHFARGTVLVNGFGPTEATVVTQECIDHNVAMPDAVPIGSPVGGISVSLARAEGDDGSGPVGEIVVESPYVALGYHNLPDETALAFAPETPHSPRAYRTGDLGRLLPDGRLVHAGRRDAQVKIQGNRVDPREIEAVLSQHPDVRQAAVTAHPHPRGGLALAATVVPARADHPGAAALRDFLSERLPAYGVPAAVSFIDALPLTATGKLNPHALPPPDWGSIITHCIGPTGPAADDEAPDPDTKQVCALFADVLGLAEVEPNASFFELGGTSLLALVLFVRIEQTLHRAPPLSILLQAPTPRLLARAIATAEAPSSWTPFVPIQEGSRPPLFVVHGVFGGTLIFRPLARLLGPDQPVIGLQPRSVTGDRWSGTTLEELASTYVSALLRDYPDTPLQLTGYSFGGIVAFEMARQLDALGCAPTRVIILDARLPGTCIGQVRDLLRGVAEHPRLQAARLLAGLKQRTYGRLTCLRPRTPVTIPVRMRPTYIAYWCNRLERAYRPRAYEGRVLLVCTPGQHYAREAAWRRIVPGELQTVTAPCHHMALFSDDHVGELADLIRPELVAPSP